MSTEHDLRRVRDGIHRAIVIGTLLIGLGAAAIVALVRSLWRHTPGASP